MTKWQPTDEQLMELGRQVAACVPEGREVVAVEPSETLKRGTESQGAEWHVLMLHTRPIPPKPAPCVCGTLALQERTNNGLWQVCCYASVSCQYRSPACTTAAAAVELHNRLMAAAKGAGK